jgi:hypothetical protein
VPDPRASPGPAASAARQPTREGGKVVAPRGGSGRRSLPAAPLGSSHAPRVVPTAAIRDEGTSYHYLPPSREVAANPRGLEILREVLECQDHPYTFGKTWPGCQSLCAR